jgi:protein O-GlcNAc transferase
MQHHRVGRLAEAEALYRQALAVEPEHAEANHLLGLIAHQLGHHDVAVSLISRAITSAGDRPLYYLNFSAALQAMGRLDLAIQSCRQAIALRPDYPEAFNNLGVALQANGVLPDAVASFERAISLAPGYAEAHFNLGVARQTEGRDDLAIGCFQAALAIQPAYLAAQYNLGNAQRTGRQFQEAAASYLAVLALDPQHIDAQNNLGIVLWELDDLPGAVACFERTVALQPAYRNAHVNLANIQRQRGQFDAAIASYRAALALQPDDDMAHSGIILALDHHPDCTPAMALAERRAWNAAHAAALTAAAPAHTNTADPERPLRVGYVSTNFAWNSNAFSLGPILAHDARQVEAVCYADVAEPDDHTAMFASRVPLLRNVSGWTHEMLADQIRADKIDILVDLDGHATRTHRLLMFARKPAPIQVTAWGYYTGTGLDAMDVMFADDVVIPADEHRWFAEEIVNLPSVMCVDAIPSLPDVTPPPSITRGTLTFGCFNQAMKLSPESLDTWARIVAAVPGSRMLFKYTGIDSPANVAMIRAAFAAHGVQPDRIDVLGKTSRHEHLAAYGAVDVQLDPFPHGGGVTTYESLLMGVPCVTLFGDRISGRVSASFMTTLGLTRLIAQTVDEYVEIAVRLAGEIGWLAQERTTLRERVLASPIANRDEYTRAVEATYRGLWQRWCAQRTSDTAAPARAQ